MRFGLSPAFLPWLTALVGACAVPTQSTRLDTGPEPVTVRLQPSLPRPGQQAELLIVSPGSDSIALESMNGVDRYWTHGSTLRVWLGEEFGGYRIGAAERHDGQLLDRLQRPARIHVCRAGRCRELYYSVPLRLAEPNRRTVALTAGWSSVFARRSVIGADRTVLLKEVLSSGIWSARGELAVRGWNAQAQAFASADEYGAGFDLSRVMKRGESVSYGLAMHLGMSHSDWLPRHPVLAQRTVYQASVGPSIMLRGITASSQVGVSTDGRETLQIVSTRVSANGNLMSVRHPVMVTASKTFAFGGGPIVSRRREHVEELNAGVQLVDDFALTVGISSTRIAWPAEQPAEDLRGSETLITLGGQYSLSW